MNKFYLVFLAAMFAGTFAAPFVLDPREGLSPVDRRKKPHSTGQTPTTDTTGQSPTTDTTGTSRKPKNRTKRHTTDINPLKSEYRGWNTWSGTFYHDSSTTVCIRPRQISTGNLRIWIDPLNILSWAIVQVEPYAPS
ncbi:hypothetical protein H0H92_001313 [Tricholoma furcatifolium]|nr:hypothetical protein H0H92_001313 [Tricholoma furcatifolium]